MIKLMSHVHQFVPVIETKQQVDISDERTVTKPIYTTPIIIWWRPADRCLYKGCPRRKCNSITASNRFEGSVLVIEDCHTVILLEISI